MAYSGSGAKRKQEEKNLKLLRELAALLPNKHCFDCGQRGPTYVNMTIGSFCCTACSGILRGLNPPHRVKSISMATFTSEEVEFIRNRGNDECRKVWLGLYDGEVRFLDGMRDDQQIKDHLIKKYERKQWYVSPAEIAHQAKLMAQH
uniref:Arf-GAP domain-containing protein n=1 Tax=Plectus sambesii TaxID=2011161 RepID=A0A914UU83_9BILA